MRKLIILRPEPAATESVTKASEMGLDAVAIPLFAVEPVAWDPVDPARYAGIVATSANAFRHGGENLALLRTLPVYAVGEATAAAARSAGFTVATTGEGGREGLRAPSGPLLHLAGHDHLPVGRGVEAVAVYSSRAIDPPPALDSLDGAVVAVHSPRAGRRLAELVEDRAEIAVAAISPNAAEACGEGWENVTAAGAPREAELLALASELCQNKRRR